MPPANKASGRRAITAIALASLVLTAAAPSAFAQTPEELAMARQTFNEGKDLERKNSWAAALEKFQKVASVKMTPQVRFHIALCEENLGKLVSALRGFELAAEEAKQLGSSAAEVAQNAPPRAEALRKRIAKVQVNVSGRVISSRVLLDNGPVASSAFGTAIAVDPGAHVVEVKDAEGKTTFHQELLLEQGGSEVVEVKIDDPDPAAQKAPPPKLPPPPPPSRVPIYVTGAAGVAFLAGSAVFYGLRANTISQVQQNCKGPDKLTLCDPRDQATADAGRTFTTLSGVFLGVGIAGVAAAGAIWIVQNRRAAAAQKSAVHVVPMGTGLQVIGSF